MKAIVADPLGGPEVLSVVELPVPEPGEGQALVRLVYAGVNYLDVYFRSGLYPVSERPVQIGSEGAGTITNVGPNVQMPVGARVAYAMARGAYAEYAVVPARLLARLPDTVSFEDAATLMLQGTTAHYLTRSTFPLRPGMTCLIHAAAGGAGLLTVQLAKIAGATVIGTVSTAEKAKLARAHGADYVINYSESDFVAETKKLTNEHGVEVVYDSVGAHTFHKSLDCIRSRGYMVLFGQSSGAVGNIDPLLLSQKGSLFLTRPNLAHYLSDAREVQWRAAELFQWLAERRIKLHIHGTYALEDAGAAHRDLESRRTTGKLLIRIA